MGNLGSCFKTQNSSNSKTNMAKLVDSQGHIRLVDLPITVAEIMLENPGFALTLVEDLQKSHRLLAMRADDTLIGRKVYLLFPVDKVNSRLTDLQLASIDSVLCSSLSNKNMGGGRTRGRSKVSPDMENTGLAGENLEELVKDLGKKCTSVSGQRTRVCKVWEPVLQPILEEAASNCYI